MTRKTKSTKSTTTKKRNRMTLDDRRYLVRCMMAAIEWHQSEVERLKPLLLAQCVQCGRYGVPA